jgi:hypothetical protein
VRLRPKRIVRVQRPGPLGSRYSSGLPRRSMCARERSRASMRNPRRSMCGTRVRQRWWRTHQHTCVALLGHLCVLAVRSQAPASATPKNNCPSPKTGAFGVPVFQWASMWLAAPPCQFAQRLTPSLSQRGPHGMQRNPAAPTRYSSERYCSKELSDRGLWGPEVRTAALSQFGLSKIHQNPAESIGIQPGWRLRGPMCVPSVLFFVRSSSKDGCLV